MIPAAPIEPKPKLPVIPLTIGAAYTDQFEVCADPDVEGDDIGSALWDTFPAFKERGFNHYIEKRHVCRWGRVHWKVTRL